VQQLEQRRGRRTGGEAGEVGEDRVGDRLAGEVPHDRAQLGRYREAQAVVDSPDVAIVVEQAVTALAIGVVGDEVEHRHHAQRVVVAGVLEQREVVLGEVGVDEALVRPAAVGSVVARHRLRNHGPPERGREDVRRDLAAIEAVGKVPQRTLATQWLVDRGKRHAVETNLGEERSVRTPRQPPRQLHLAPGQDRQSFGGRWPLVRGHTWPKGSRG
jgi:hypothetical protein